MKLYHNWVFWEFTQPSVLDGGDIIDVESRDVSDTVWSIMQWVNVISHEYIPSSKEVFYHQLKESISKLPWMNTPKMYNTTTRKWNRKEQGEDIVPISLLFWWNIWSSNNYKDGLASIVLHAKKCEQYWTLKGTDMDEAPDYTHTEMIGSLSDLIFKKYPTMNYASMDKSVEAFIIRIAPLFLEWIAGRYGQKISYSETEKIWLECVNTVMSMKPPNIVLLDKP